MSLSVRPLETTWERRMLAGDKGEAPRPKKKTAHDQPCRSIIKQGERNTEDWSVLVSFFCFSCFGSGARV